MVFGVSFAASWLPVSLALVFQMLTLPRIAIHPLFTALGYVKQNAWILLFANITYVIFALTLSHFWGLVGLVIAGFLHANTVFFSKLTFIVRGRRAGITLRNLQAAKISGGGEQ
jgi:O-antigen/teichoic acid export membrane protein